MNQNRWWTNFGLVKFYDVLWLLGGFRRYSPRPMRMSVARGISFLCVDALVVEAIEMKETKDVSQDLTFESMDSSKSTFTEFKESVLWDRIVKSCDLVYDFRFLNLAFPYQRGVCFKLTFQPSQSFQTNPNVQAVSFGLAFLSPRFGSLGRTCLEHLVINVTFVVNFHFIPSNF